MKKTLTVHLAALAALALSLPTLAANCEAGGATGCELDNRMQASEMRLAAAESALAALAQQVPPKKAEVALECQTVTKDSEVLLYEDRVVVESDLPQKGYTLVSGGCSFPDWRKYEMPALVAGHPKDDKWVCAYKNSRPARISGYATYCRAVLKD